jgi:hypothetical protein
VVVRSLSAAEERAATLSPPGPRTRLDGPAVGGAVSLGGGRGRLAPHRDPDPS